MPQVSNGWMCEAEDHYKKAIIPLSGAISNINVGVIVMGQDIRIGNTTGLLISGSSRLRAVAYPANGPQLDFAFIQLQPTNGTCVLSLHFPADTIRIISACFTTNYEDFQNIPASRIAVGTRQINLIIEDPEQRSLEFIEENGCGLMFAWAPIADVPAAAALDALTTPVTIG